MSFFKKSSDVTGNYPIAVVMYNSPLRKYETADQTLDIMPACNDNRNFLRSENILQVLYKIFLPTSCVGHSLIR